MYEKNDVNALVGLPLGLIDKNGRELRNGDRVRLIRKSCTPITDGWGSGDRGSMESVEDYYGTIFYVPERAEFRVDDERLGKGRRSRALHEFDEIIFAGDG
jgi:hypothetical protein